MIILRIPVPRRGKQLIPMTLPPKTDATPPASPSRRILLLHGLRAAAGAWRPAARGESRGAGAAQSARNRDAARRSGHRSRPHPCRRHALSHPAAHAADLAAMRAQPRLAARLLLRSGACRAGRRRIECGALRARRIGFESWSEFDCACGPVNQTRRAVRISSALHRAPRCALRAGTRSSRAGRRAPAHRRRALRTARRALAARMVRRSRNPHDAAPGLRPDRARPTR